MGHAMKKALLGACLVLTACNDADFKSDNEEKRQPKLLTSHCSGAGEYADSDLNLKVEGDTNTEVILEGEFCPKAPAQLRLVFLVDFSLSMYNAKESRGNDQVLNGTCGRLEAARAIAERHVQSIEDKKNTEIKASVISFSDDAEISIPLAALEDFEGSLDVEHLCGGSGSTNYRAAFEKATELLTEEPGTKVVYLVSDGLPTLGGGGKRENAPRHRDAAMVAADDMRKIDGVIFNTVYLGNIHEIDDETLDPEQFLKDLTGDPDRVKLVDKAENLATEILTLENPPVVVDVTSAEAAVIRSGGEERVVDLVAFEADPSRDQVWTFKTAPFKPFEGFQEDALGGADIRIVAKDEKGDDYRVTFTIQEGKAEKPAP